jgi:hypothetical protein
MTSSNEPAVGAAVITIDGRELGKVKEVSDGWFKVDARLRRDYWLPSDLIETSSAMTVQLSFASERLSDLKSSQPGTPAGSES